MLERWFEGFLWNSRFFVLLAVIASLMSSVILFVLAFMTVFDLSKEFFSYVFLAEHIENFHVDAVSGIISSVDDFLLATVLLIFALGMYELFISKIDAAEEAEEGHSILMIKSLDDLKDRLAKVVLMILVVAFFKEVMHIKISQPLDLVYMASGILMVSLALYFAHKGSQH